jgi:nucleotide-binding universal stress UspA family protein
MQTDNESPIRDKHLLVAVDQTDNSKRAVLYVADFLGGFPGFQVTLFSIIPEPDEDFFDTEADKAVWASQKIEEANKMLENYRQVLFHSGFPEDKVHIRSCVNEAKALSDVILQSQCGLHCCTVVVGRQHKSKTEEFLFGSTSSRLVREAKGCAVWVVE